MYIVCNYIKMSLINVTNISSKDWNYLYKFTNIVDIIYYLSNSSKSFYKQLIYLIFSSS